MNLTAAELSFLNMCRTIPSSPIGNQIGITLRSVYSGFSLNGSLAKGVSVPFPRGPGASMSNGRIWERLTFLPHQKCAQLHFAI